MKTRWIRIRLEDQYNYHVAGVRMSRVALAGILVVDASLWILIGALGYRYFVG